MLDLRDVHYFVSVVDHKGFSAASDVLDVHKSTLSLRVKELEKSLGVRLINRTSRQFLLTEVGAEFYDRAVGLLRDAQSAQEAMRQRSVEPSGTVRITSPMEVSQFLLRDLLPKFLRQHPKVSIQESATDRFADIVGEGFDLAIRGHSMSLPDSELAQRPLSSAPWYLFASPAYLRQAAALEHPGQLEQHALIAMARKGALQWQLQSPGQEPVTIPVHARYQGNNLVSLKEAACANLGIAALPCYICHAEIAAGTLVQVLPEWIASDARFTALIPSRAGMLPAVRALVDFLAEEFPKLTALR